MAAPLTFTLVSAHGERQRRFTPRRLIVAGWTGRDPAAMEHHIAELEALGIPRPAKTPLFYRNAASRLTQAPTIQVCGPDTSGEAEYCLVNLDGRLWVGAASDHTDRKAEAHSITLAKQLCDKPIAPTLWPLDEVAPHWDQLQLTAHIEEAGTRKLYQSGPLAALLAPQTLLAKFAEEEPAGLQPGDVLLGGTLPAIGGVRPAERFEFALEDPVLGREVRWGYGTEVLKKMV